MPQHEEDDSLRKILCHVILDLDYEFLILTQTKVLAFLQSRRASPLCLEIIEIFSK